MFPDPTPWTDVLPNPSHDGYINTATIEVRMRVVERAKLKHTGRLAV